MQHVSLTAWRRRSRAPRWLLALRDERITRAPEPLAPPMSLASDAQRIPGAPVADPVFESFYQRHARDVFGYLWRLCGDEQMANDLTQEVFFRAWRQFEKLQRYERPEAWLFRVATNLALNERRHQRVVGPVSTLRGHERAAGDHAAQLAERAALRSALEGLPVQQRAAFILREVYGHSCAEIAEMLGVSQAAAKMTLSRARERLRSLYLKEDAE